MDGNGPEEHRVGAAPQRHAALIAELPGHAGYAVREREANLVTLAVDDRVDDGPPTLQR